MGQSLKGKVAIVTGAGRGIGRATALALAEEGVHVGLLARTESHVQEVASEVEAYGVQTAYAAADVSSLEQVEQAIEYLNSKLGSTNILINNAGIGKSKSFLDFEPDEWRQVLDVNLTGVFYVTRTVLPQLIDQNGGDIINISSMSGLRGTPGSSAYSASKFGLLGLTESLAQEVRTHNIRVSALTPSKVITDLTSTGNETEEDKEKFMQPEDLAEYMVSQLKLHPRIFIKSSAQWATNPF
ncbi:3-ketoacyl-ACP reductase [Thalassobacillus sp. CUG 92003]|uniref:3-ketoacyl-ACP reductase n=1 Tax=Thalassobacillus sp. CUG 92003 TaxID=2736641 RepID=UPI0015E7ABBD|nr:3-ketoacyl-ACP reductase [Thalassobacillus sp. CUG 92003]